MTQSKKIKINGWQLCASDCKRVKHGMQISVAAQWDFGSPFFYFGLPEYIKQISHHFDLPTRTFIDIGASYGLVARSLAFVFDNIYCFEPNPNVFKCLIQNVSAHTNITCTRRGVSNESKPAMLHHLPHNSGIGAIVDMGEATNDHHTTFLIDTITLDRLSFKHVDYIKIDTEGHEFKVLKGSKLTIQRHKPIITCEIEPGDGLQTANIFDFLYGQGYHFVGVFGANDYTFIHNDKVKDARQLFMGRKISACHSSNGHSANAAKNRRV